MTAEPDLLPLPKWAYDNMHLRLRATSLQNRLTVYARAVAEHNVAHATAARDAEIEALRERAERLAEAIRAYKSECDNPAKDYVMRAKRRDEMFAALNPTAAQEAGRE